MSKHVSNVSILVITLFMIIIFSGISIAAGGGAGQSAMCQKDHRVAVNELIASLVQGRDQHSWATAVRDLVSAETCMLSYGEGYNSQRLYGRLAKDLKSGEFRKFGWRVFHARLAESGFEMEPASSVFKQQF